MARSVIARFYWFLKNAVSGPVDHAAQPVDALGAYHAYRDQLYRAMDLADAVRPVDDDVLAFAVLDHVSKPLADLKQWIQRHDTDLVDITEIESSPFEAGSWLDSRRRMYGRLAFYLRTNEVRHVVLKFLGLRGPVGEGRVCIPFDDTQMDLAKRTYSGFAELLSSHQFEVVGANSPESTLYARENLGVFLRLVSEYGRHNVTLGAWDLPFYEEFHGLIGPPTSD